jgi:large conductance mechanosensitive channel
MASIRDEFVKFIEQGNLIQLAIAFVIAAAFTALIMALVTDMITPLIGALINVNFSTYTWTLNNSVFYPGLFLDAVISFIILALVVFLIIALPYQRYQDKKKAAVASTMRPCPECLTSIPIGATRCSACGIVVTPVPPATPPKK